VGLEAANHALAGAFQILTTDSGSATRVSPFFRRLATVLAGQDRVASIAP